MGSLYPGRSTSVARARKTSAPPASRPSSSSTRMSMGPLAPARSCRSATRETTVMRSPATMGRPYSNCWSLWSTARAPRSSEWRKRSLTVSTTGKVGGASSPEWPAARAASSSAHMGLGSPMASAKRRMAPFSTSCTSGSLSRPMSDLSSMRSTGSLLAPRGKVQHRHQSPELGDRRGGVNDGPGGGLVARESAADGELDRRVRVELDHVAGVVLTDRERELEAHALDAVDEAPRELVDAGDLPCGDLDGSHMILLGDHRDELLVHLVQLEAAPLRREHRRGGRGVRP